MSFSSFLTGGVVGGALVYGALTQHVVRTDAGVELIPKSQATFAETYLDVRTFTPGDWTRHRLLVADILAARKEHLFTTAPAGVFGFRTADAGLSGAPGDVGRVFR